MDEFLDDLVGIPDDSVLFRLISFRSPSLPKYDELGGLAVTSQGFQDYPEDKARELGYPGPCMSVAVASALAAAGLDFDAMYREYEDRPGELIGIAAITAGAVRALRGANDGPMPQGVAFGPGGYPGHAVVFSSIGGKKTSGMQKALARAAYWVVAPVALSDLP